MGSRVRILTQALSSIRPTVAKKTWCENGRGIRARVQYTRMHVCDRKITRLREIFFFFR